jgi:ribosomal-protein-alanine N-acetyltransferase
MFKLNTRRLFLRQFEMADLESIYQQVFSDAEVMRFGNGPQTREWTQGWIETSLENYKVRGFGPYAVMEKDSSKLIGYCGLFFFPDINGQSEIEIGYRLGRSTWGHGYATEAAIAVRDHALQTLHRKRLVALIDPHNTASIRVAQKLGMHYEKDVMLEGYTHPDHLYVLNAQTVPIGGVSYLIHPASYAIILPADDQQGDTHE